MIIDKQRELIVRDKSYSVQEVQLLKAVFAESSSVYMKPDDIRKNAVLQKALASGVVGCLNPIKNGLIEINLTSLGVDLVKKV